MGFSSSYAPIGVVGDTPSLAILNSLAMDENGPLTLMFCILKQVIFSRCVKLPEGNVHVNTHRHTSRKMI